jgi:serine phosphatase RsbU (regulator of sigma subunit)
MSATVRQKLLQFVGDTPQYDDMTLVAVRLAGRQG